MKFKLIIDPNAQEEIVITAHAPSKLTKQIENLVRDLSGNTSIVGYFDDGMQRLEFSEIECITVIDRRVIAIDKNGKYFRLRERLCDLEPILPSYFIRINKSSLANEHGILRFDAALRGSVDAIFGCGYREYVSRRCFAEIRRRYEKI